MAPKKKKQREYHSMQEFRERFYPTPDDEHSIKSDDPAEIGAQLAKQSLAMLKDLLSEK
jgi:hypothetical protein